MHDIDEKFSFMIDDHKMVVQIKRTKGCWSASVLEGNSGLGKCSGGVYGDIQEYKEHLKRRHTYCYHFFKSGGNQMFAKSKL